MKAVPHLARLSPILSTGEEYQIHQFEFKNNLFIALLCRGLTVLLAFPNTKIAASQVSPFGQ
jgi:hypothetical protein